MNHIKHIDINIKFFDRMREKYNLKDYLVDNGACCTDKLNRKNIWYHWSADKFTRAVMNLVEDLERLERDELDSNA